jgi:UDP-N-acetylglucosamine 4,6-dehydratase (inverting)
MSKKFFKNKSILITGGTGSFGKEFVKYLLNNNYGLKKIIIFSRDEFKQFNFQSELGSEHNKILRFFIGDVRDLERVKRAFHEVDYVVHAAALKQVPSAEYNPMEVIKTNVVGTQNVIESCLEKNVKRAVLLSTDKASSPINLYGASKLCADRLFISANNIKGSQNIKFSVVRYGNVMGSRGSVLENFIKQSKSGQILLTDENMTRFNIFLHQSIELVLWALKNCNGGEIVVPKIPSFYIKDLAKVVSKKKNKIKIVGIRDGEKLHEEMISSYDAVNTVEYSNKYLILTKSLIKFYKKRKATYVKKNFIYNSLNNSIFLTIPQLERIVKKFDSKSNLND